jgi:hypothetical protein
MKKIAYLLIAPYLLIDACSSARLEHKDTRSEGAAAARVARAASTPQPNKTIVIQYSETENDGFIMNRRFAEQIDQDIKKRIKQHR